MPLTLSAPLAGRGLRAHTRGWTRTGPNREGRTEPRNPHRAALPRPRPRCGAAPQGSGIPCRCRQWESLPFCGKHPLPKARRERERVGNARTRLPRGFPPESRGVPPMKASGHLLTSSPLYFCSDHRYFGSRPSSEGIPLRPPPLGHLARLIPG